MLDIAAGSASSDPEQLTRVGGLVYFTADDGDSGRELWASDGSTAGTRLVLDIQPGPGSSSPHGLTPWQNGIAFAADDGVHGAELWTSDGSPSGTVMVEDLSPGPFGSIPLSHRGAAGDPVLRRG